MNAARPQANSWQSAIVLWAEKRGAPEASEAFVAFFEKAFKSPLRLYPNDAWFGVHGSYISLTIGNMWLAAITSRPKCVYLIAENDLGIRGLGYFSIPSTLRYVPLGFTTVKSWSAVHTLNKNKRAWDSYATACELILQSPISRNVITRNLYRKARVGELAV